ncbi:hypothetical protein BIW11_05534 [Tropilaelaps mercedesae]|uniref:Uncharacterized protein n=1 Tax=Tropilaelaps mercedesae TaxID=418985 RepID=A0A1V9Y1Y8_9ACAR|nr:hypothetical protein BIW11_05534 [Tropilaelaps mercedesae]
MYAKANNKILFVHLPRVCHSIVRAPCRTLLSGYLSETNVNASFSPPFYFASLDTSWNTFPTLFKSSVVYAKLKHLS